MAIRARIKSKIKSLIFKDSSRTSSNRDNTSQTVSKTTFTAPNVSTSAQHPIEKTKETANHTEDNISDVLEPPAPSLEDSETALAAETGTGTVPDVQDSVETEPSADGEVDTEGATFIVEVVDLFPETCPHCGASSHNNWIRIENKFACGSCEAAY